MTDPNPCLADWERRERAWHDAALVQRDGVMERRIVFEVGYDHTGHPEACGGGGHGRHGMQMRWLLIGPAGAVQWVAVMTNWFPGNVTQVGTVNSVDMLSAWIPANLRLGDGMSIDLGYHAPSPRWEDQGTMKCEILPEGYCYYDGSSLNAEPVLEAFLAHGPHAVWASLARFYGEVFT